MKNNQGVICSELSGTDCNYKIEINYQIEFLTHYNEVHDPEFIAKCHDDLLIEYQNIVYELNKLNDQVS